MSTDLSSKLNECRIQIHLESDILKSTLWMEQVLWLIKNRPLTAVQISLSVFRGREAFRQNLARTAQIKFQYLPLHHGAVENVRMELEQGQTIELTTCFDETTANRIVSQIWGVNRPALRRISQSEFSNIETKREEKFSLGHLVKSLRIRHWAKNLLVFLGPVLAHKFNDFPAWILCGISFVAFSLLASAVYLCNDLLDLESDRAHAEKRHRPFASGNLPLEAGLVTIPLLLAGAAGFASFLPQRAILILGLYFATNVVYSFSLKKLLIVDVITLTCLHISRILVGAAAADVAVSSWLIAFSSFFFFGLAMLKRFAELKLTSSLDDPPGRGYHFVDQTSVFSIGLGSSLISVLVFVLYLENPRTKLLYRHTDHLWLVTLLLLYWVSRVWLLAERGQVAQDPVTFALKDKATWITAICLFGVLILSI